MRTVLLVGLASLAGCGSTPRPTADPGPLQRSAKAGEKIVFDGSASKGTITKYTWNFGDGADPVDGVTVEHVYTMNMDYTATLTVRGPGGAHQASVLVNVGTGCTATAMITVVTADPQPNSPVVFGSGGSTGCMSASLKTYDWDFGDGSTVVGDSSKATVSHTYAAKNTYMVKLRVVDVNDIEGVATRALGVGVAAGGKPLVTCPMTITGEMGKPITFSAAGSDPAMMPLTYAWTFSDSGTATGTTVQHTFASMGSFTSTVVATTTDSRTSDPCQTMVTVTAPLSFTGTWLLNPAAGSLSGCQNFSPPFPALSLSVLHTGDSLLVGPMGGTYPSGNDLSGILQPPPDPANTFVVRKSISNVSPGGSCTNQTADHSVRLTFTSATTVTGVWNITYSGCTMFSCASCNCTASVMFSGIKM